MLNVFPQQTVSIHKGTTVRILSLYSFIRMVFLRKKEKKLAQSFNFTLRYIDDVISLTLVTILALSTQWTWNKGHHTEMQLGMCHPLNFM